MQGFFGGPLSDDYTQKGLHVFLLIKTDGWEWVRAIAKAEVFSCLGNKSSSGAIFQQGDGDVMLRLVMQRTDSETGRTRCSD